jgi:hypothetical protein
MLFEPLWYSAAEVSRQFSLREKESEVRSQKMGTSSLNENRYGIEPGKQPEIRTPHPGNILLKNIRKTYKIRFQHGN